MRGIVTAESLTAIGPEVRGCVLVAGSHGGAIAAHYAARAGVHAVILNDAGCGRDDAGIAGLVLLESIGMCAATVSHASARIGDGSDALRRGVVSHVNRNGREAGVVPGMRCADAAARLCVAPGATGNLDAARESRYLLCEGEPAVWGLDSLGELVPDDAGRILVIGSHGALHGGRRETALSVDARIAVFHDAGIGIDDVGVSRLPVLAERGIAAATVDYRSARIGDCRSMWDTGTVSHLNEVALRRVGDLRGHSLRDVVTQLARPS